MNTATPTASPTMEDLHSHPKFLACTPSQQKFLVEYTKTKDPIRAVEFGYGADGSDRYKRMWSQRLLHHGNTAAVLDWFFGRTEKDRFLAELQRDIKKLDGVALQRARALYARVAGLISDESEPTETKPTEDPSMPDERFKLGDIVEQNGRTFRITAIDNQGRPTDGEPLPIDEESVS